MTVCRIHAKITACAWMVMENLHANALQDGQVNRLVVVVCLLNELRMPRETISISSVCLSNISNQGKTCADRITQCYSGQCANGGSCAPTIIGGEATSVCICSNGWSGAFCTEPIDQCQGQPCYNGGTCESGR